MSTLSWFFFDDDSLSKEQEERLLADPKVATVEKALSALAIATGKMPFAQDLGKSIQLALGKPLTDGLVGACKTWSELREFTDPAKHPPDEQNTYSIAEHTVKSTYQSRLEVRLNELTWSIGVEAEIALDLASGNLLIKAGRIWELRPGTVTGSGALRVEDTELASLKTKPITFPGVIKFEQGVAILA